mgnify:CR=1 FL=1
MDRGKAKKRKVLKIVNINHILYFLDKLYFFRYFTFSCIQTKEEELYINKHEKNKTKIKNVQILIDNYKIF